MTALIAPRAAALDTPVDLLLFCPMCGAQHVDEPDGDWLNPPHRSHLCHGCGCVWRPADVPTNGVSRINTAGKADSWGESNWATPPCHTLGLVARRIVEWVRAVDSDDDLDYLNGPDGWADIRETAQMARDALARGAPRP